MATENESMKRSPLRKQSKVRIAVLQRKLWELCKQITRRRYGNTCYTCGAKDLVGANWHTGHLWPKSALGAWLKYDLRVLRPQCYHCNINLGGNGAVYYRKMVEEMGQGYMDALEAEKEISVQAFDRYLQQFSEYEALLGTLVPSSNAMSWREDKDTPVSA